MRREEGDAPSDSNTMTVKPLLHYRTQTEESSDSSYLYTPTADGRSLSPFDTQGQSVDYVGRNESIGNRQLQPPTENGEVWVQGNLNTEEANQGLYEQVAQVPAKAAEGKKIPRPSNAWILYRSDRIASMRAAMREGDSKPTQADLSKQFGHDWKHESQATRTYYERLSEQAREEHAAKHPDWKFSRKQRKVSPSSQDAQKGHQEASLPKRARTTTSPRNKTRPSSAESSSDIRGVAESTNVGPSYSDRNAVILQRPTTTGGLPQAVAGPSNNLTYTFPTQHQHNHNPNPNPSSKRTVYDARLQPPSTGLNATLGRRNSSAIELFGDYRPQGHSGQASSSRSPQGQNALIPSALFQPAINESTWSTYRTPSATVSTEINFNIPPASLAGLPWGLVPSTGPSAAPSFGDNQPVQYVQMENQAEAPHWVLPTMPQTSAPAPQAMPTVTRYEQLQLPSWMLPFCNLRVKPDDFTGVPLGDFLLDLHNRTHTSVFDSFLHDASGALPEQNRGHSTSSNGYSFP